MSYRLAIFDLDGTLLDTLEDLKNSVNFALTKNGFPKRNITEICSFIGSGARHLCTCALPDGVGEEIIKKVMSDFQEHYKENGENATRPYDGICKMLADIRKAGVKTAVLSNKPDHAVIPLCEHYFPGLIDFAAGEIAGIPRKPAPDGVVRILEHFGVDKSEAVFIGDSDTDVITAKNAGLAVIAVTWGFRDIECLRAAGATTFASTTEELFQAIM